MAQRAILCILLVLLCNALIPAQAEEEFFSHTRHKAALLALLCYNPQPVAGRDFACQRAQLFGLCHSFVQEGGYDPARAAAILHIDDPAVEHLMLLIRELDRKRDELPHPGALLLAGSVALAYSIPSADGLRAAVHAARFSSADPDQPAINRAAYSIMVYALEGKLEKKEDLIQVAALNCDDEKIAQAIRAIPLREFRKLPPESTALGKFCRAVFFWQHSNSWEQALSQGRRELRYPETMHFLAMLSAAWVDLPHMPEDFVWSSLQENEIRELCADLHNLARTGILNPVAEKLLVKTPAGCATTSRQQLNGKPVTEEDQAEAPVEALPPIEPLAPLADLEPLTAKSQPVTQAHLPQKPVRPTQPFFPTSPLPASHNTQSKQSALPRQRIVATTANAMPDTVGEKDLPDLPLQPRQPTLPKVPAAPTLPVIKRGTARLTTTTYTPKDGETVRDTIVLLPELEAVAPISYQAAPESPEPAPRARTTRPAIAAPESQEELITDTDLATLPQVDERAERTARTQHSGASREVPTIVVPAEDSLHTINFPLE